MKFIGRKEELKAISDLINSDTFKSALIYGRRRVGKSELVKEAITKSESKIIYYECKQTSEENNVFNIKSLLIENLGMPNIELKSFDELLTYFFKTYGKDNITLVLDEYTYLREHVEGLDSIIQSAIDNNLKISNCKLIVLGSYVDTMKSLIEYEKPLYGRFDYILYLKPMNYLDSSMFYPNYSYEDKVRMYSVFGGIPFYNQFIDDKKSVKENIIHLIASVNARLASEIPEYLEKEIGKMTNANEVFNALALGYSKYNDILNNSHVSSSPALAETLNKLNRMEVIEKITPINDPNNKKKTSYYVYDNLTLFYYRYIYRYTSQMNILDSNVFYDRYIKKDFEEEYVPNRFEYICKEYLINENRNSRIDPPFFEIGKYYYDLPKQHKNGEFDIVTKDDNGYIFYEVKFKNKPVDDKIIDLEIKQVNECGLECYKYGFISKSGFKDKKREDVVYIDIDDLYKTK